MKTFLSSSLQIRDKKRNIIVATPRKYCDQFGSSLQIISRGAFEAAVYKLSTPVKSAVGFSEAEFLPPPNDQGGSSLKFISREVFEATAKKKPKTTKTSVGSSWFRSICLGEGAHGVVYLASRNDDVEGNDFPVQIAIKSAPIYHSFSLSDEEEILKSLSSPYVISCYGSKITPAETRPLGSDYNLILEYCSGGSILDFIKYRGKKMEESEVQLFALHILKGINYIHSNQIIHCDIKPANVLLKRVDSVSHVGCSLPNGFVAKLADFGLSLRKTSYEYGDGSGFTRGTLLYMSPELLCHGNLDYCADIWSYGCTILEMLTGKRPWSEFGLIEKKDLKDVISDSTVKPFIPTWLSDDARDFLEKCLEKDPQKRYDSTDLLKHKFLSSVSDHFSIRQEANECGGKDA